MSWVSYLDQCWGCEASKETSQDWEHKGHLIVSPPHSHPEGPLILLYYSGISQAHVLWQLSFFRMASGIRHCLLLPSLSPQTFKLPCETPLKHTAGIWYQISSDQTRHGDKSKKNDTSPLKKIQINSLPPPLPWASPFSTCYLTSSIILRQKSIRLVDIAVSQATARPLSKSLKQANGIFCPER